MKVPRLQQERGQSSALTPSPFPVTMDTCPQARTTPACQVGTILAAPGDRGGAQAVYLFGLHLVPGRARSSVSEAGLAGAGNRKWMPVIPPRGSKWEVVLVRTHASGSWLPMVTVGNTESEVALRDPMDCNPPGSSLSMGFSRQEHCSGWPSPSPGELPDPGIEPGSPALQADTFTISADHSSLMSPDSFCFPPHLPAAWP